MTGEGEHCLIAVYRCRDPGDQANAGVVSGEQQVHGVTNEAGAAGAGGDFEHQHSGTRFGRAAVAQRDQCVLQGGEGGF